MNAVSLMRELPKAHDVLVKPAARKGVEGEADMSGGYPVPDLGDMHGRVATVETHAEYLSKELLELRQRSEKNHIEARKMWEDLRDQMADNSREIASFKHLLSAVSLFVGGVILFFEKVLPLLHKVV